MKAVELAVSQKGCWRKINYTQNLSSAKIRSLDHVASGSPIH